MPTSKKKESKETTEATSPKEKKTTTKKTVAKKKTTEKAAVKKSAAKKSASTAKSSAKAKKRDAKKTESTAKETKKKTPSKKAPSKKAAATKETAQKTGAKGKTTAKKSSAKKTPSKKAAAKGNEKESAAQAKSPGRAPKKAENAKGKEGGDSAASSPKTAAKKEGREKTAKAAPKKGSKGARQSRGGSRPRGTKGGSGKKAGTQGQGSKKSQTRGSAAAKEAASDHSYRLLINAESPEECRVALLDKGKLTAFHVETVVNAQNKGNIYKGKVVSVEANLQAAFVDIGTGKNAFLAFSEIHPEYYANEEDQDRHWKDLAIKKVIHEGQEVLVEVVKEVTGNKGANMTTFLSLPGRYVVLLIGSNSKGISRQIDDRERRAKLREMLDACKLPEGVGYIIRTASKNVTKKALMADVRFLINLWKDIREKGQTMPAPALVYQEQNVVARFLRDHFTEDIQEIMVDSQEAYNQVTNFLELLPAAQRKKTSARLHKGPRPLLNSFNVEEQIEQIYQPNVKLPSGGSIVINPTEALVAIDVNSGRTDKNSNFEETIFLANMEAAEELARQLQLRDLGGLIVVDFIDMRSKAHIREVEKKVKSCMKRDKAKVDFSRISKFGLMEISRQKMAAPVLAGNYKTCEHCQGRGIIKSVETQALVYLRQIQTGVTKRQVKTVQCRLPQEVGHYLLNKKRAEINEMERRYKTAILIETDNAMSPAQGQIKFIKG